MTITKLTTPREAFDAAVKDVRGQGVKIAQGVSGSKTPVSWGERDQLTNYAFTRSGDVKWNGSRSTSVAHLSWRGNDISDLSTGYILARTFARYGFKVQWNTTVLECVSVDISSWDKDSVGYVPEPVNGLTFLLEVSTAGSALLRAREAKAKDESFKSHFWDVIRSAGRMLDANRTNVWNVDWKDIPFDVRLAGARLNSEYSDEALRKNIKLIDEYLFSPCSLG